MERIPRIVHFIVVFLLFLGSNPIKAKLLHNTIEIGVFAPVVDFTFDNPGSCSGTPITFTPIVNGNAPYTYVWDFGDGTTSTESNPTHTFTALGCGS